MALNINRGKSSNIGRLKYLSGLALVCLISLILLTSAETSSSSAHTLPTSASITSAELGSSAPNDSTSVATEQLELTTPRFLSSNPQNDTQTTSSEAIGAGVNPRNETQIAKSEAIGAASAPRVTVPDVISMFLNNPAGPLSGSVNPSRRQMFRIQGLDQILDKLVAEQSSSSDVMKLLDGMKDKLGFDRNIADLFRSSSKVDTNETKVDTVPPEESSSLVDSSVEDLLRFICSTFGGNTYVTDVIDKSKQILDRIATAYDVDCSPVVKAVRALLEIVICTFAGNADSAVNQLEPFKAKHFDVLFRAMTQFFRIPEKVARNFLESANKSIRQIMSFISNNRNMVDMMLGFLKPKDEPNDSQESNRNFDFDTNKNNRRKTDVNVDTRDNIVNAQWNGRNSDFDYGNEFENNVFSMQNESVGIVDTIKRVINLSQALFRGRKSLVETMSLGQQAIDILSPFFNLDAHHAGVHRLVERLDKMLCVMKDTSDSDIKNDLTKLGRESTLLLPAVMEFIKTAGGQGSSSRLTELLQMSLDRIASIVSSWENSRTFDYSSYN
ncbi:hypothetical protein Btru_029602 [Bulinus truncatus]|nr:hypothetical protein Btru_029602 [Bulinus truncatus]